METTCLQGTELLKSRLVFDLWKAMKANSQKKWKNWQSDYYKLTLQVEVREITCQLHIYVFVSLMVINYILLIHMLN